MSINKVLIQAQYSENYSENEVPFWKKKGGQVFEIEIDADLLMYSDPAKIFTEMLMKHCNEQWKYEYVSHEILFSKPIIIGTADEYKKTYHYLEADKENV